jgi:hypothetical protein
MPFILVITVIVEKAYKGKIGRFYSLLQFLFTIATAKSH